MQEAVVDERSTLSLVKRAQNGDQAAFEELIADSRDRLLYLIRTRLGTTLRQKLDPDDLLQETAMRALQSINRFEWRGHESFRWWLQGIAENAIRESCRKLAHETGIEVASDVPGGDSSPSKHGRRNERFERLQKAIDQLPEDYRRVILLARIEGLKIHEIAEKMDRSVSSVKNLLLRGMRQLRQSFGDTESLHLPDKRLWHEERGDGESR